MLFDDGIVDHLLDSSLSPDLRPSAGVERIGTIGIDAVSRMRDLSESLSSQTMFDARDEVSRGRP